jgi:hypothetical protein
MPTPGPAPNRMQTRNATVHGQRVRGLVATQVYAVRKVRVPTAKEFDGLYLGHGVNACTSQGSQCTAMAA